jgi:hypothetical protein
LNIGNKYGLCSELKKCPGITKWKDNRDVLCITTGYHPEMVEVRNRFGQPKMKPSEVAQHNNYMSGVDRVDQMISYYSCPRKTIRWPKKILFHLLDVTINNGFYIYKEITGNCSLLEFRENIIRELLNLSEEKMDGRAFVKTVHCMETKKGGSNKLIMIPTTLSNIF